MKQGEMPMQWLFAAFAVVWISIFLYLFGLDMKSNAIAREIEGLKAKLDRGKD
jgi:CcmD family protein